MAIKVNWTQLKTVHICIVFMLPWPKVPYTKDQLISIANCQAVNSSKQRTNEFVFTTMRWVFVRFFEESLAKKKRFEII